MEVHTLSGLPCCANCAHAYIEDSEWYSSPALMQFNLTHACKLINPDDKHIGAFVTAASTCKRFEQCAYPRRVWPKRPYKMMHDGVWWTDQPAPTIKADSSQRSLEDFA